MKKTHVAALCFCLAVLAGQARAVEPGDGSSLDARAISLRAEADARFAGGDYEGALRALRRGYALTRDLRFLFNLGVTYHSLGECELARDHYQRYLLEAPSGPFRQQAAGALSALQPVCGRDPPAGAPAPPPASAGALLPPDGPSAVPEASSSTRTWSRSLLGLGGAGLVATGVTALLWSRARTDYEELLGRAARGGTSWDACCARRGYALESQQVRYRAWSAGLGLGSILALGTSAVLSLSGSREQLAVSLDARGLALVSFSQPF